jgi:hypothetical protein
MPMPDPDADVDAASPFCFPRFGFWLPVALNYLFNITYPSIWPSLNLVIMAHQRISLIAIAALFIFAQVSVGNGVAAFRPARPAHQTSRTTIRAPSNVNDRTASPLSRSIDVLHSPSALSVRKKNNTEIKKEVEKAQQAWDWKLILVYMTPWRNPNSIFVYMFALIYALGKYSESHNM